MFILSLIVQFSCCTIIGIDLGSDTIKVAVGSRYNQVHLVKNIYSNDVTPNIFSYSDNSHWAFGEGAIDQCRLYPESCIQNQRLPTDNKLYFSGNSLKGYQIVALSMIHILQTVKNTEKIVDDMKVVVAIPPSMTLRERSYLYSALAIAGANCIRFITSTYAPIEAYVNEHKYYSIYDNTAVFIDIGHEGVRVSGFEFDNTQITQKFGQYNDNFGGKSIDENLLKLIVDKYSLRLSSYSHHHHHHHHHHHQNDHEYQKNRISLLSEIRKAREQLTFRSKVTFNFMSKSITLTRKDIDDCSTEIKKSLKEMIHILKHHHQDLLKTNTVHLIGGCSQIPCLQDYINKLLPKCKQLKTMDPISSVCKGAVYLIDSDIQTNIKVHNPLVTTEILMKTGGEVFKLFSYDNKENFNSVVSLNNIDKFQVFQVIDKNDNNHEFTRFTIDVPNNNNNYYYSNRIDVGFSLNCYLMPIPDQTMLIQQFNNRIPLQIRYDKIGWEISSEELTKSKTLINSMVNGIIQRLSMENHLNPIEEYKMKIQNKLQNCGFWNLKKIDFNGICYRIDSLYRSCLENNNQCPEDSMYRILQEFKSLVHSILKIDDNEDNFNNNQYNNNYNYNNYNFNNNDYSYNYDDNYYSDDYQYSDSESSSERQTAIDELFNMLESCKLTGARYDDVERWINSKLNRASMREIYEYTGILKERGKIAQNYYF